MEAVGALLIEDVFDRVGTEVVNLFKGSKVKGLVEILCTKMIRARKFLDDADVTMMPRNTEGREILNVQLRKWIYEADNLLDEFAYDVSRSRVEASSLIASEQIRKIFSSGRTENNLNVIISKFDDLEHEYALQTFSVGGILSGWRMTSTTPLVDESAIYGRNDDKEAIIKLLLSEENDVGVIPIVGMAGIGKTTLAQLLYNDERVQSHFKLQAWVCFNEKYPVGKLRQITIGSITLESYITDNLDMLQTILKQRFLLVLDDVWNDDNDWQILLSSLRTGAKGSKIIVTTRNSILANNCTTAPVYHLRELNDEDCWSLFSLHALRGGALPELEKLRRAVTAKCKGLPIYALLLGDLLSWEKTDVEWEMALEQSLLDSECGQRIRESLILSHNLLPPQIRRCFTHCAIFPKGHEIQQEELIHLWMAEGLLVQSEGSKDVEETGAEYIQRLVSSSFFRQSSLSTSCFVMHDLMHDLAISAAGMSYAVLGNRGYGFSDSVYHLSFAGDDIDVSPSFLVDYIYSSNSLYSSVSCESLRTFVSWNQSLLIHNDGELNKLLATHRRLRVLSLPGYYTISQLHDSIGMLKHLRYLNISQASITKLPREVCKLYNLQTLILFGCKYLIELPSDFGKLINLFHLDIRGTKLQCMPSEMSKLTKLRKLTDFVVGKQKQGANIRELGALQHLRGELSIWNLQNVFDPRDALEANLNVKKVNGIKLSWDGNKQGANLEETVLMQLQPHVDVKYLLIAGYGGNKFPDWLGDSSFSYMVSLKLDGCKYCSSLPPLGQLKSLQELWITEFHGIVDVGAGFYGSSTALNPPFASLKILRFKRMPLWREWISYPDEHENGAFPLLEELYIHDCPSLEKVLPSKLPCLTTLDIQGCQKLVVNVLPSAPAMLKYVLKDSSRLLQLQELPSGMRLLRVDQFGQLDFILERRQEQVDLCATLEAIRISRCHSLKFLPLEYFPKLKRFDVYGCPNLESFFVPEALPEDVKAYLPESPSNFPLVQEVRIRECPKLMRALRSPLPSLTTLEIEGCPQLVVASVPEAQAIVRMSLMVDTCRVHLEESSYEISNWDLLECFRLEMFSRLKTLQIICCPNLKSLSACRGPLGNYLDISRIEIWECNNLESLPEGLAASNLKVLSLRCCTKLKSLPDEMHRLLPSLEDLQIVDCPGLEMFPEGGLPSKLESLEIQSCKKLFAGRMKWDLQRLTYLSQFVFGMCEDAESFPENMLLPPTLKHLEIGYCQNMKSLDKGLQHFASLEELMISNCPSLQSMPEEGLPASVSSLSICNCPLLEERYQQKNGEEWSRISGIPCIKINYRKIN